MSSVGKAGWAGLGLAAAGALAQFRGAPSWLTDSLYLGSILGAFLECRQLQSRKKIPEKMRMGMAVCATVNDALGLYLLFTPHRRFSLPMMVFGTNALWVAIWV